MVSILLLKLIHLMLGPVGKTSLPKVIGPFWSKVGTECCIVVFLQTVVQFLFYFVCIL